MLRRPPESALTAAVRMVEQAGSRSSHDEGSSQRGERQLLVQPVADCPAHHAPGVEVHNDRQVQPAFSRPDVGEVRTPLLVGSLRREVLLEEVGRDREGMKAVGGALEATLLPGSEPVLAHQPSRSTPTHNEADILQLACHARAAVGPVRQLEGRADMGKQHEVLSLPPTGGTAPPGEVAAWAHPENLAQALDGELFFRRIDELDPHRLPSLAKKAVARFRISRSWRSPSFSRRSRFSSAALSS